MDDLSDGQAPGAERDGGGDADLVALVREGRDEPYAELYRRHRPAALALARTLTEHTAADDVVSEAFEKLLHRIRDGKGPEAAFRPYLLRTVRTVAVDASRRTRRLVVAEDPGDAAGASSSDDELVDTVHERTTLARAFAALPERWQTYLWLSFVDDADRDEIATILGVSVGSVSALGYRAREGLRRAYLDAHLRDAPTTACAEVWPLLAASVRSGLGATQQAQVDDHLAGCEHCRAAAAELGAVNTRFGAVLAPLVLGAAAPAYLAAVGERGAVLVAPTDPTTGSVPAEAAAGGAHTQSGGLSTTLASLGKAGAAGVAVVACVSIVAVIALLVGTASPPEQSVAPRTASSDGTGDAGSTGSGDDGSEDAGSGDGATDGSTDPDDPTSATSGDPSTSGVPTSGQPTTSAGPPGVVPTGGPIGGPTGGPTGGNGGPTGGPPTSPGSPPTSGPTGSTSSAPNTVDAGLGGMTLRQRTSSNAPVHVSIPVSLQGGSADLEMTLSIRGLTKFTVTSGAGEGGWSCTATTPMAGKNKTAILKCTLSGATPGAALDLGIDVSYAGAGSVYAELAVTGGAVDTSSGDNTATINLPARQAD